LRAHNNEQCVFNIVAGTGLVLTDRFEVRLVYEAALHDATPPYHNLLIPQNQTRMCRERYIILYVVRAGVHAQMTRSNRTSDSTTPATNSKNEPMPLKCTTLTVTPPTTTITNIPSNHPIVILCIPLFKKTKRIARSKISRKQLARLSKSLRTFELSQCKQHQLPHSTSALPAHTLSRMHSSCRPPNHETTKPTPSPLRDQFPPCKRSLSNTGTAACAGAATSDDKETIKTIKALLVLVHTYSFVDHGVSQCVSSSAHL
jgi:hypothetical protein